jgi:hypothetical protein
MVPMQAVKEVVEGYVSQVDRQLSSALDARRLTSASAATGGFLGGPASARSPAAPGTAGNTAKLADLLWQNLSKVCSCSALSAFGQQAEPRLL